MNCIDIDGNKYIPAKKGFHGHWAIGRSIGIGTEVDRSWKLPKCLAYSIRCIKDWKF